MNPSLPTPILPPSYGERDENGVDLSLIRYLLSLSPRERLLKMKAACRSAAKLYEIGRKQRLSRSAGDR